MNIQLLYHKNLFSYFHAFLVFLITVFFITLNTLESEKAGFKSCVCDLPAKHAHAYYSKFLPLSFFIRKYICIHILMPYGYESTDFNHDATLIKAGSNLAVLEPQEDLLFFL